MPNRIIKESICTSETLEKLTPDEEVLFYRILVNCDDYGRMDGRSTVVRAKCFPLRVDKIKDKDVEKWLQSLVKENLIILYIVEDKPYLQVTTWNNHQNVRASKSKYPAPDSEGSNLITIDSNCNQEETIENKCPRTRTRTRNTKTGTGTEKKLYGEFVKLTEDEYSKLVLQHGEYDTKRMIEILDNYKGSTGKKYESDYRTILNWVIKRVQEEKIKFPQPRERPPTENERQMAEIIKELEAQGRA